MDAPFVRKEEAPPFCLLHPQLSIFYLYILLLHRIDDIHWHWLGVIIGTMVNAMVDCVSFEALSFDLCFSFLCSCLNKDYFSLHIR